MSKTSKGRVDPQAFIVYEWELSDLEGRLLTLIESLGLPDKQELAVKSLVRQAIWQVPNALRRISDFDVVERVIADNRAAENPSSSN